ncbi:cell division transport system ATP-binding protein [Labedella gwakjiensis]|uniref:Cell division ATP-binding protein FtsE n=1 Tax=Labedella gwakjiensis TaxID=390269 RepID=A0A2P8H0W4_9MICO|nr:cell division ATP-binding protein FtsE [Labedella gwakjiensis]PSL39858.1 cell division transport system ATP-binding protein [Labedella gwakjiensis]RUQ85769.1 cell division ATP-binding protein FtsE [Labedella gwakjiensis]
MIRFDQVTKKYAGTTKPALNAVDFEVKRGEFVFLVGASGSGKSSCLRLILKEEKPSNGTVHVLGHNVSSISNRKIPYFRRNLGVVFQDFRLLPNKTVFQNVAFTLQVIGKSRGFVQEAVPDVLKMVGLENKAQRMPHELSGGEQQRVAIARAIVNKPQVLLADEPTGNLDPATSAGIMQLLERINANGTTVVMATHEAAIVDKMQRRVIELVEGGIVRDETHGGYGTTAVIPELGPRKERGVDAEKAKRAVEEAARETPTTQSVVTPRRTATAETGAAPRLVESAEADAPVETADDAPVSADATTHAQRSSATEDVDSAPPWVTSRAVDESDAGAEETGSAPAADEPPAQPLTQSQPIIGLPLVSGPLPEDTQEHLSLAERLGLRAAKPRDEDKEQNVGPTQ